MGRRRSLITATLILTVAAATAAATISRTAEPTPAPQPDSQFTIPLSDHTTATAAFLPAPDHRLYLIYATNSGQLVFYTLHRSIDPPPPPPPPPPPDPTTLKIAIVENPFQSTIQQRQVMADRRWRDHIPKPHTFYGIIPHKLIDPTTGLPPPAQAPFIIAAKTIPLPVLVFLDQQNAIIALYALPDDAETILALIATHGITTNATPHYRPKQLRTGDRRTPPPRQNNRRTSPPRMLAT